MAATAQRRPPRPPCFHGPEGQLATERLYGRRCPKAFTNACRWAQVLFGGQARGAGGVLLVTLLLAGEADRDQLVGARRQLREDERALAPQELRGEAAADQLEPAQLQVLVTTS